MSNCRTTYRKSIKLLQHPENDKHSYTYSKLVSHTPHETTNDKNVTTPSY